MSDTAAGHIRLKESVAAKAARRIDQIRAEQTRALFRNCSFGVITAAVCAVSLAATLHGLSALDVRRAYQWCALVAACALCHLLLCVFYRRDRPSGTQWRAWNYPFTSIEFAEGLAWCLGIVSFLADGDELRALVFLLAWPGIAGAAIVVPVIYLSIHASHIFFLLQHHYPFSTTVLSLLIIYPAALPIIVIGSSCR